MNTSVALDIEWDLKTGEAEPSYPMYPEDKTCTEEDIFTVRTDGSHILLNGKKYVPFDLNKEEDVKRLAGAWIADACMYGYVPTRIMITGIWENEILTTNDDAECEESGHFRSYIWPVELLVDYVFADTGEPCGKEVKE